MINKNKYIILLWIINLINYQTQDSVTNPLNNQIILKENNPSNIESTLDNNTINNPIKYRTFQIIMVYILAIISYIRPFIMFLSGINYKQIDYFKYYNQIQEKITICVITTTLITIAFTIIIYGWITKKYIHNLILQSKKSWTLYIISLIVIGLLPDVVQKIIFINFNIFNIYSGL